MRPMAPLLVPERMTNVKVRSFTPPGQVLDLHAELGRSRRNASSRR